MARMHTRRHGKSGSHRPFRTDSPKWVPLTAQQVEEKILEMAGQGLTTSVIGLRLRDLEGVPSVKLATGKRVQAILAERGKRIEFPEDLRNLIRRAAKIQGHNGGNKRDLHNQRNLHQVEAKIRRLVRYYRNRGLIARDWAYSLETAKLLVE